jgi:metallo-beta-lactamase family protein
MDILHHGAVNGVTGSCHELKLNEETGILIDCGLFQGAEVSGKGATHEQLAIDFPVAHIKALVVTHVHIDHVGRIPYLLAAGFEGPIICSEPSATLLPLVLEDALKVGVTSNKQLISQFLKVIRSRLVPLPYHAFHTVLDGLQVKLKPAGRILGSAYVECVVGAPFIEKGKKPHKVIFSGDLGAPYAPLLSSPKSPYACDTLVIESTYGDKNHPDRRTRRKQLESAIKRAVQDRGVVLIPAFSIGRTQELLYELEDIIHRQSGKSLRPDMQWQEIEIVIDSPLASTFTECYRELMPFWDKEAKKRKASGRHPLSFEQLTTIDDHQTHLATVNYLQKTARPVIVIAASGMCAGGRIMNYLKALISDERTDIVFVGYQAQGTPGESIQKFADKRDYSTGQKTGYVMLDEQKFIIQAQVHTLSGYSAHAGQKDLLNFVKRMRKPPKEIRIVHGDSLAKQVLQHAYQTMLGDQTEVIIAGA